MVRTAIQWMLAALSASCASVIAKTPLPPGKYQLEVTGYGAKASAEIKCLRPEAIRQLTGGEIPGYAPKQACYTVVILASSSSSISRAVTSYANAERELFSRVGKPSPESNLLPEGETEEEAQVRRAVHDPALLHYYEDAANILFSDAIVLDKASAKTQAASLGNVFSPEDSVAVGKLVEGKAHAFKKINDNPEVIGKFQAVKLELDKAAAAEKQ